ncbi:nucleotide disphospho-sugar-binding domain-containing protein, partial [Streptomyces mirabilis]|uniref:glycosyltransferase n=1 Tax=Streptomyces mirabilis TaxID=68239 RepID=UPI0033C5C9D1
MRKRNDRLQTVIARSGPRASVQTPTTRTSSFSFSVAQLPLLEWADAVACHASHNTVCEPLWYGVPLVVAPIRDDQPVVAGQAPNAGAGIRVRLGRVTARRPPPALAAVLHDPAHRAAADRIRVAFRAAGGSGAAATHLEQPLALSQGGPVSNDDKNRTHEHEPVSPGRAEQVAALRPVYRADLAEGLDRFF